MMFHSIILDIAGDELRFGDEIECGVFVIDSVAKTVKLSVRSRQVELNFKFKTVFVL